MHISIIGSQSSIHIVRWANSLVEGGHKVDVLSMHMAIEEFHPDVNVIKLFFKNPFGYVLNCYQVRKLLRQLNPDIVHAFYALGHGFLGRISGKKPFVLSVMGSDVYEDIEDNPILERIVRKNLIAADQICSTSNTMATQIKKILKKSIEIEITPFGIDTKLFSVDRKLSISENREIVIGTIKHLSPKYGIDILIKSFAKFTQLYQEYNLKLIIVGGGVQMNEMIELAKTLNVYDKCKFTGRVQHKEVPAYLSKIDIFLALSRYDSESFGVAVLEASAMEVPVIVANTGGLPEVVKDKVTGFVVSHKNIDEIVKSIYNLVNNEELRKHIGKNGRRHVIENYEWEDSYNKMINIYEKLIIS